MNIEKANTKATERMMEARPVLVGLGAVASLAIPFDKKRKWVYPLEGLS